MQLAGKVREQFYQLYFIDRAIQVTRENLDLLLDFTRLTETRYATGMGLQQDVLKAQLEHSRMTERLLRLEQERRSAAAELYSLVGTDQESEIRTGDLSLPLSADLAEATLVQLAVEQRPMFQAYDALGKGYSAQRESARLDYYPDLNLWAGYRFREEVPGDPVPGTDFVSAGISINLPLFREKRSEAVAEAESGQRMVLSQAREFRNQVRRAIRDNLAQVNKNRSLVDLYRSGIVPQAHQAVEAGVSAYQVGELEFLSLLDSLLTLDRYQVDLYRAEADYLRSLARLEAVVGGHLEKASLSSPATQEKRP